MNRMCTKARMATRILTGNILVKRRQIWNRIIHPRTHALERNRDSRKPISSHSHSVMVKTYKKKFYYWLFLYRFVTFFFACARKRKKSMKINKYIKKADENCGKFEIARYSFWIYRIYNNLITDIDEKHTGKNCEEEKIHRACTTECDWLYQFFQVTKTVARKDDSTKVHTRKNRIWGQSNGKKVSACLF